MATCCQRVGGKESLQLVVAIDPTGSGFEAVGDLDGGVEVLGVDGGGETVAGRVADLDDLVDILELGDRSDRSEDLLVHNLHVRGHIREDGGLNEVALFAVPLSSNLDDGSLLLSVFDVAHDAVELELRDLGSLESGAVERVADDVLADPLLELLGEGVVDRLLDVDARTGAAALAVVEEDAEIGPLDGLVDVGVGEDDVGRLASELEGDLLQVAVGGRPQDLASDQSGSGEGDLVDVHVAGERGAGHFSETRDDVDDTGREASLVDELGGHQAAEGSQLGSLQDDDISGSDGGTDLPGPHDQREVPPIP